MKIWGRIRMITGGLGGGGWGGASTDEWNMRSYPGGKDMDIRSNISGGKRKRLYIEEEVVYIYIYIYICVCVCVCTQYPYTHIETPPSYITPVIRKNENTVQTHRHHNSKWRHRHNNQVVIYGVIGTYDIVVERLSMKT